MKSNPTTPLHKKQLLRIISSFVEKNGRIPKSKELGKYYYQIYYAFGSYAKALNELKLRPRRIITEQNGERLCNKCNQFKTLTEFSKGAMCKKCASEFAMKSHIPNSREVNQKNWKKYGIKSSQKTSVMLKKLEYRLLKSKKESTKKRILDRIEILKNSKNDNQ